MDKASLESTLRTLDIWLIVFGVFVAIGVAGESVVGFLHWRRGGQLQAIQASEILELTNSVANANERALEAQLALETFKAPRSLNDAQLAKIAAPLHQFVGQEYAVTTFWDLKEPLALSNRIHQALQLAGWKFIPPGTGGAFLLGGIAGVQVWVHPDADAPVKAAADALIGALNAEQIEAELKLQNPNNPKDNKIALNVGTKP
jgi:uncharacterized membrane protein